MSFILDALKRSEQERQREQTPTLHSIHSEFSRRAKPRAGVVHGVAIGVAIAAAMGIVVWAEYPRDSVGIPKQAAVPTIETAVSPSLAVAAPPVAQATPGKSGDATPKLLEAWELNEGEQRYLGELAVSLHVYSSEAAQRTVIINGLRVKEGQSLGQDIELMEITPDGIIVKFREMRVHLSTVQG